MTTNEEHTVRSLDAKRREQTPQVLARLALGALFTVLWIFLWVLSIPMPVPFLLNLFAYILFFLLYWRLVFRLPTVRAVELAHYGMLALDIIFYTVTVYFLGGASWLGALAYVFGLIFTNAFLDLRRGLVYTSGASLAFVGLVLLEATGAVPHYVYLEQGALRYTDPQFVATTIIGSVGVFFSIYLWVNWVGYQLRRERDGAVRAQEEVLGARAELERANAELEELVNAQHAECELATAALQESEERLRAVFANVPVILWAIDPEGILTVSEGKGLKALGLKSGEAVGLSIFDVFRDVPAVLDGVRNALAGKSSGSDSAPITVEVKGLMLEMRSTPIRGDNGEILGVIGVAMDVTERKRAEEALRVSEERFRSLYTRTPGMLHSIDASGRLVDVSDRWLEVLGYERSEVIGRRAPEFLTEESRHYAETVVLPQLMKTGHAREIAYQFVKKNGEIVDILLSAVSERDKDGGVSRSFAILTDVTERKRAEEALRESEARYRWLIEGAPYAMVIANGEGRIVMVNAETEKLFKYNRIQLVGEPLEILMPEHFQEGHLGHRAGYLEHPYTRPMGTSLTDLVGRRSDASEFPIDIHLSSLKTDSGVLVTAVIRDVTEQKRAQDALQEQARRDPLTNLLNRRAGLVAMEERLARAKSEGGQFAVLVIDIDRFKAVNDVFGHEAGDNALIRLGLLMAELVGEDGVACRLGGDEFEIGLEDAGLYQAVLCGEELRASLQHSLEASSAEGGPKFTISVGVACYPKDGATMAALGRHADQAMYAAKAAGGDASRAWSHRATGQAA